MDMNISGEALPLNVPISLACPIDETPVSPTHWETIKSSWILREPETLTHCSVCAIMASVIVGLWVPSWWDKTDRRASEGERIVKLLESHTDYPSLTGRGRSEHEADERQEGTEEDHQGEQGVVVIVLNDWDLKRERVFSYDSDYWVSRVPHNQNRRVRIIFPLRGSQKFKLQSLLFINYYTFARN